jgi:hypothetical protein
VPNTTLLNYGKSLGNACAYADVTRRRVCRVTARVHRVSCGIEDGGQAEHAQAADREPVCAGVYVLRGAGCRPRRYVGADANRHAPQPLPDTQTLIRQPTDTLARVSAYLLTSPASTFDTLLRPLLTPQTIPNTLVVVLLDWSQPWSWLRQLRRWVLLLRSVLRSLDAECTDALEEVMQGWRDRGRGGGATNLDGTASATSVEGDVALPVGPGEWEDGLGLPLCVVCQNVSSAGRGGLVCFGRSGRTDVSSSRRRWTC